MRQQLTRWTFFVDRCAEGKGPMPNQFLTLTVSYTAATGATITGGQGGSGDATIYRGEAATLTFVPGNGVRSVNLFSIKSPTPLPVNVIVTQSKVGNTCVVVDTNALSGSDSQVIVVYGLDFTDINGTPRSIDPQLVNVPGVRPSIAGLT